MIFPLKAYEPALHTRRHRSSKEELSNTPFFFLLLFLSLIRMRCLYCILELHLSKSTDYSTLQDIGEVTEQWSYSQGARQPT
uniref:Uncharacterized protein n=1 Tax=Kalanchoe fedtschenkoi TaxID=63787 RepID=A0A7N0TYS6_KALFE